MLYDEALKAQLFDIFSNMQTILREYQSFSLRHIRSLESRLLADALLEAVSNVSVDRLETAYAKTLILLAHLKQQKQGKTSRLWSSLEGMYDQLVAALSNAQLITALFEFYDDGILVADQRSWFFPEPTKYINLTKPSLVEFFKKGEFADSKDSIEKIVRIAFASAIEKLEENTSADNFFMAASAVPFSRFARLPFALFQEYACEDTRIFTRSQEIGRGAFGTICCVKVSDLKSPDKLVAKFYDRSVNQDDVFDEICISCLLQHDNIVAVFPEYSSLTRKGAMLVMAYHQNGHLHAYLTAHPEVADDDKIQLAQGILSGIEYLHDMLIVHLDISLNNVLVSQAGIPKICDFGASVSYESESEAYPLRLGNPDYAPPDLCQKVVDHYEAEKAIDSAAPLTFNLPEKIDFTNACSRDLFAFMVVLWRMFVNDSVHTETMIYLDEGVFKGKGQKDPAVKKAYKFAYYHAMASRLAKNPYLSFAEGCTKQVVVQPMVTDFFRQYPGNSRQDIKTGLDRLRSQLACNPI